MLYHTGSGVAGNAFCCKQDYNGEYCKNGATHTNKGEEHAITTVCSPPSFVPSAGGSPYSPVLTGDRNYQFFAFCPAVDQNKCGVPGVKTELDHHLKVGTEKKQVNAKDIHFKPQSFQDRVGPKDAEYDACHFEVSMDESILSEWNPKNLHFKVTTKSATMNAFIYEAKERSVIGKPVTGGNKQVEAGDTF